MEERSNRVEDFLDSIRDTHRLDDPPYEELVSAIESGRLDLPPIVVPVVKLVPGASGLPTGRSGAV